VVETLLLLPLTVVAQRLLGFARCRGALERLMARVGVSHRAVEDVATEARATTRLFDRAVRHCPCKTSCMHQALVLWWVLRRRGIASRLWIGVHKDRGRFEAHAWVECRGSVLNDPDSLYQRFTSFPDPVLV
jgi:Transglutaminase-like superfamily